MTGQTNFDRYLQDQLRAPDFATRFEKAGEAWDLAIKLAGLRKEAGLSQKELAKCIGTSQHQISRLESPSYEGHSLSMIREKQRGRVFILDRIQRKNRGTVSILYTKT